MNKYAKVLLVFFIPILIFLIAASLNGFIPFGKMIYNIYDSGVQYPGIFEHLKDFSFFSLKGGLGFNFYGTATYYVFSPLNLLFLLFKMTNFPVFFALIIYLKIGLASLFMYIFLKNDNKKDNIWQILFAIVYALCGFMSTYYYNTMWSDGIYILPLILLGINKLILENKKGLYIVTLSLAIIFNYYIGYMICIFSIIYFIYKMMENNSKIFLKQKLIVFITSSLLVGLIVAVVILPSFFALMQGKVVGYGDGFTNYFALNSNIKSFFYMLTPASFQLGSQSYGPALIYSSLLAIVLVTLFFFNNNFSKKLKITVLVIIAFYFFGFAFNLIDYAWQLFQRPVWWQSRYSFTFSIFLIIIAYKSVTNLDGLKISKKQLIIVSSILSVLIIISTIFTINDSAFYQTMTIIFAIISIFFLIDYFILINNKNFIWFIVIMLFIELFINSFNSLKKNITNSSLDFNQYSREVRKEVVNKVKEIDNGLYRLEFVGKHSSNDAMLFDYNGISTFNSVRNQKFINLAEYYLEINVDSHCGVYLDNFNPYLLSIFNIKYVIDYEFLYFDKVVDNHTHSAYENPYPLSFGFVVNKDILNVDLEEGDYKNNLNKIVNAMIGEEVEIYTKVEGEFVPNKDLLLVKKDNPEIIEIHINNEQKGISPGVEFLRAGTKYHINGKADAIDIEVYEYVMDKLSSKLLIINENSNSILDGNITLEEDELLLISIADDKGLKIEVNGAKYEPVLILDSMIGIELKKGNSNIKISYVPPGLLSGASISLIGVFLSIWHIRKRNKI